MTDTMITTLQEFVAIKSISSDKDQKEESFKAAQYLENLLKGLGATTKIASNEVGTNPIVFAKLGNDPAKKTLIIYGHYDVQPAEYEDGWDTQPFELTEKDGYLYGRGATDDKAPIVVTYYAIKDLLTKGELPVNFRFIYEGEEESGSVGFEETVTANKEFLGNADAIIVMDNYWLTEEHPALTYGLRGLTYMGIEIKGPDQDLHSGSEGGPLWEPMTDLIQLLATLKGKDGKILIDGFYDDVLPRTKEEDALYDAIDFDLESYRKAIGVSAFRTDNVQELLKMRWREPTLSIHGIEGAFAGKGGKTVIPAKVIGKVSMRLAPNQDPEKIAKLFTNYVERQFAMFQSPNKLTVHTMATGNWWLAPYDNEYFKAAEKATIDVWGEKPQYTREGGSIPIVPFLEKLFEAPAMLLPVGQSTDRPHSQNERIRILNMNKARDLFKIFINYL